ncbi:MAG TPA: glycosyltransferase family 4 protein [Candidatus Hydrogenedentes bacterium]|nr:glycosyltransferase family 4 protein [Candidatus Hydrogenedentota bacterium]
MRILKVITWFPPAYTGQGYQVKTLVPFLQREGAQVVVLTSSAAKTDAQEIMDGFEVHRLRRGRGRIGAIGFAARVFVWAFRRRKQWDIIHLHGAEWSALGGVLAARALGKKSIVVLTLMGADDPQSIKATRLGRMKIAVLGMADRFVALSTALVRSVEQSEWDSAKTVQLPEGVDEKRFAPLSAEERRAAKTALCSQWGWDPDAPLAVFVGAIIRRKGVDIVAQAWPSILAAAPTARLLFVGPLKGQADNHEFSDAFVASIRARFDRKDVAGTAVFTDAVSDPERFLRAADVFVFPSRNEGLPNALIEAQTAGVPTVVADMPGIASDIVEDGKTGFIVPQDDPAAVASAVTRILQDPALAASMREAARLRSVREFNITSVARRTMEMYRRLLD